MKRINLSLKILGSFFLLTFTGILIAQEIDSLPGLDSLPSQTLAEVVITANRYGSLQIKTPEAKTTDRQEEGGQFLHFSDPDGTALYFIKPKW